MIANNFRISYSTDDLSNSTLSDKIAVVGTPYHADPESLIKMYSQSTSDYLEYESRHASGNYALIDQGGPSLDIVTSPAFCGGYFVDEGDELHVTATFDAALDHVDLADVRVDFGRLLAFLSRDIEERSPFQTVFEPVRRLPPGTVLSGNGEKLTLRSYLTMDEGVQDFSVVQSELCERLRGQDIILCLSGGIDSTALACMLLEHDVPFRAITFDYGPGYGNAPGMSQRIVDKLGIDREVIDSYRPHRPKDASYIRECMQHDIIKPYTPTHSIEADHANDGELFIYAQNADNLSMLKMRDQVSYQSFFSGSPTQMAGKLVRFLSNLQYTGIYCNNELFRRIYLRMAPKTHEILNMIIESRYGYILPPEKYNPAYYANSDIYDVSASEHALYTGLLSSGRPSFVRQTLNFDSGSPPQSVEDALRPVYDPGHINTELDLFDSVHKAMSNLDAAKALMYFMNAHNAHKQQSTFTTPGGNRIEIPFAWGPSISYFMSNNHSLKRAMYPKYEFYNYAESRLGTPHYKLMEGVESGAWEAPKRSPLLENNRSLVDPDKAILLNKLAGIEREPLGKLYEWVYDIADEAHFTSYPDLYLPLRLLNLELILDNVYREGF